MPDYEKGIDRMLAKWVSDAYDEPDEEIEIDEPEPGERPEMDEPNSAPYYGGRKW